MLIEALVWLARGANLAVLAVSVYVLWEFWHAENRSYDEEKLVKGIAYTVLVALAFIGLFV